MRNLVNKNKNILICIFFAIITFCKGINLTSESRVYIVLYAVGVCFVLIKMFFEQYKVKEILSFSIILLLSIIIMFISHNVSPLFMVISIMCLKDVDLKEIIKVMFVTLLITTLGMIVLSSLGIIENKYIIHKRDGFGTYKRFCFGYLHPNIVHMNLLILITMFYYLYSNKLNKIGKIISFIVSAILNIVLYQFTISRTSFLLIFFIILYEMFLKKVLIKQSKIMLPLKYTFIIFFIISLLLAVTYNKMPIVKQLDIGLSGRIYYCSQLITNYPISFLGEVGIDNKILFDNSYFSILYNCGLFFTVCIIYLYTKLGSYLYKNELFEELILMSFMCLFCFIENVFLMCMYNFSLLFISYIIFGEEKKLNE